jgi:hydroxyacylglutathione hydrolase
MTALDTARLLWLVEGAPGVLWRRPDGGPVTARVLSDASRAVLAQLLAEQGFNVVLSTTNFCGLGYPSPGIPQRIAERWVDPGDGTVTVEGMPYRRDVRPCNAAAEVTFAHKTGLTYNYGSDAGIVRPLPASPGGATSSRCSRTSAIATGPPLCVRARATVLRLRRLLHGEDRPARQAHRRPAARQPAARTRRDDAAAREARRARRAGAPPGDPADRRLSALRACSVRAMTDRTLRERAAAGPPQRIADGVWLIRGGPLRSMNVYLLAEPGGAGVTVFDAGEKGMADAIEAAAAPLGGIRRVVLSHADNDHRGAAAALARSSPVHCHAAEVDAAQRGGHRDYWDERKLSPVVRILHRFLMKHAWEGGPTPIAGTLQEGDEVAGFRVVELPGHAPGLIGLFREADRLALVSDCIYMTSMWGRPQPAAVPLEAYNLDTAQARDSVRKLAALRPAAVWPGHRGPLDGADVVAELERAAGAAD